MEERIMVEALRGSMMKTIRTRLTTSMDSIPCFVWFWWFNLFVTVVERQGMWKAAIVGLDSSRLIFSPQWEEQEWEWSGGTRESHLAFPFFPLYPFFRTFYKTVLFDIILFPCRDNDSVSSLEKPLTGDGRNREVDNFFNWFYVDYSS